MLVYCPVLKNHKKKFSMKRDFFNVNLAVSYGSLVTVFESCKVCYN